MFGKVQAAVFWNVPTAGLYGPKPFHAHCTYILSSMAKYLSGQNEHLMAQSDHSIAHPACRGQNA